MVVAVEVAEEDVQGVVVGLEEAVGEVEGGLGGRVGAVVVLAQGGRRDFDLRGHFSDQLDKLVLVIGIAWVNTVGCLEVLYTVVFIYTMCSTYNHIRICSSTLKPDARAASYCLGETELIAFQWRIGRLCSLVLILKYPEC